MTKYHTVCYLGNPEGGQYVTTFDLFSDKNQVDVPNSPFYADADLCMH